MNHFQDKNKKDLLLARFFTFTENLYECLIEKIL